MWPMPPGATRPRVSGLNPLAKMRQKLPHRKNFSKEMTAERAQQCVVSPRQSVFGTAATARASDDYILKAKVRESSATNAVRCRCTAGSVSLAGARASVAVTAAASSNSLMDASLQEKKGHRE